MPTSNTSTNRFNMGGYTVYPRGQFGNPAETFHFNKVIGEVPDVNIKDNYNRTELKTFGKFPSVFYVGNTNYKTFTLQGVFTTQEPYDTEGNDEVAVIYTAYNYYRMFKKLVDSRLQWCVRGSVDGEDYICDIEITQTIHNQNAIVRKGGDNQQEFRDICEDIFFKDYIEVTISCTEIDEFEYGVDGANDSFERWDED